jgi:hypothetical protein
MFTSLPVPLFREFPNKFNEKSGEIFFELEINSRSSGRRLSYINKMLTLSAQCDKSYYHENHCLAHTNMTTL